MATLDEIKQLSHKHYQEYLDLENDEHSPNKWILGSFATVRGLMRIPHDNGHPEITTRLLKMLEEDIAEFKTSLKKGG